MIFLLLFVTGLAILLYFDRNKIENHYILFYRRTKRGIDFIDRIARRAPGFWNYYGWTGVLTGLVSIPISLGLILFVFQDMILTGSVQNGPSLIFPGLVSEPQLNPGVSFLPIETWVIGVGILMFVHEMSHGIVARTEDFEINSVGWIILGILPGAFVEPKGENMLPGSEENQDPDTGMWEQGTWTQQLKVLGAGSFANYLTGVIFIILAIGVAAGVSQTETRGYIGVQITNQTPQGLTYQAQQGYPTFESGMRNGTLYSINDIEITKASDLGRASGTIDPGEEVTVATSEGTFNMIATERSFKVIKPVLPGQVEFWNWLITLINTVGLLNILIGLFNMLPAKPLDGGLMTETLLKQYLPERAEYINQVSLAIWAVIITMMLATFIFG